MPQKLQGSDYLKKYEILASYVYNQREYLEQDIKQLQENLRYRQISQVDCLELIIAEERLKMFVEVTTDIRYILGQEKPANEGNSLDLPNKNKFLISHNFDYAKLRVFINQFKIPIICRFNPTTRTTTSFKALRNYLGI